MSRCGWTPYDGRSITARIETTLVRGEPVYAGGRVIGIIPRALVEREIQHSGLTTLYTGPLTAAPTGGANLAPGEPQRGGRGTR